MNASAQSVRLVRSAACIRPIAFSIAAIVIAAGTPASAQTISWASPVNGLWSTPANWSPQNVPDTTTESALLGLTGAYTVTLDTTPTIAGLSITNASAVLQINVGRALGIQGSQLTNNGTLTINTNAAANTTFLIFNSDATLTGTGRVVLNGIGDRAYINTVLGVSLTQDQNHTISGFGNLHAALVNNGSVIADSPGNTLWLGTANKTNNNLMKSLGGTLRVEGITLSQSATGLLLADGGKVTLANCTITGGSLNSAGAGSVEVPAGAATLADVTNLGSLNLLFGTGLGVAGSKLTNDGVITVNTTANANDTLLQFNTTSTLDGTGRVVLNGIGNRAMLTTVTGATMTHGAEHTISGFGTIYATLINDGIISATVPAQTLILTAGDKTNNNILRSSGANTTLRLDSVAITQGVSGRIIADQGKVSLVGATINGGTIETSGGGIAELSSSSTAMIDVHNQGTLNLLVGTGLGIAGSGLTNDGTITVNPTAAANLTVVQFNATGTLGGSGRLILNGVGDRAYINTLLGVTATNGYQHTISGYGNIHAMLINDGTITADVPGQTLTLMTGAKANNKMMNAVGAGSVLRFDGITVMQDALGHIAAEGGKVSLVNTAITGGILESSGAGLVEVSSGSATLTDVTNLGALTLPYGTALGIAGSGLTNDGTITVNPTNAASNTFVQFNNSSTLSGGGQLIMNGVGDRAYLNTLPGVTATQGFGHTITGIGRMYGTYINQGTIAPGSPIGRIEVVGTYEQAAQGSLYIQIGGTAPASGHDQLTVTGQAQLSGLLNIAFTSGFTPGTYDTFTVLTGAPVSGKFQSLGLPSLPHCAQVVYTPTAVVLMMCYANCDGSTAPPALNVNDFQCFLNRFAAGDMYANCDGSSMPPILNVNDFQCYLNKFAASCP